MNPIALEAEETTIGRDPSCQVVLETDAPGVSRQHIKIRRSGQQFLIADLGSSNGTFVNGQRLQSEQLLQSGDRIQLGTQGPQFEFVDPIASNQPLPTQVELPPSNATPPTVIGNPSAAPVNSYSSPPAIVPPAIVPPANQYVVASQPHEAPRSSGGQGVNWLLVGGGLLVGGIGLLMALRIGAALLGNGLVAGSGTPAPSESPAETSSPQAPSDPQTEPTGTQSGSSAVPTVKDSFICESPDGDTCTSDTANLTRNSAIAFTVEFEDALDASTQYSAQLEYTPAEGEPKNIDLGNQTFENAVQSVTLPLGTPEGGWLPGSYAFTLVAKNAAGAAAHTQVMAIE